MAKARKTRLVGLAGALTAAGALTVSVVGNWEGLRLVAYPDVIGVWTACYGETKGIRPGMKFTREQCDVMFIERLQEFETGMRACLKAPDALPDKTYVSFVSVTYNIGVGGFCGSSMARRTNAGDLAGACDALLMWNKAGGKVVKGLVNRRVAERKLCLAGLSEGKATPPVAPRPAPPVVAEPPVQRQIPAWPLFVALGVAVLVAGVLFIRGRRKR